MKKMVKGDIMPLAEKDIAICVAEYTRKAPYYKQLSETATSIVKSILDDNKIMYHSISCREKALISFKEKIVRKDYDKPFKDMQDLAAMRIITYIDDDVQRVCNFVESVFHIVEKSDKSTLLEENKFGYKSIHYIAKFTEERLKLPEYSKYQEDVFEIQVRTLLQHAWAEFEHDRNYKFKVVLPKESGIQRRLALVAGMLELVDREFNSIAIDLDKYQKVTANEVQKGEIDIEINSTSLREYLTMKFKTAIEHGVMEANYANSDDNSIEIIDELNEFGIKTIRQLDNIIPEDMAEKMIQYQGQEETNFIGCVRDIMLINNSDKYFGKIWRTKWSGIDKGSIDFISYYNEDFITHIEKYQIDISNRYVEEDDYEDDYQDDYEDYRDN